MAYNEKLAERIRERQKSIALRSLNSIAITEIFNNDISEFLLINEVTSPRVHRGGTVASLFPVM